MKQSFTCWFKDIRFWKFIKVWGIINAFNFYWNRSRSLSARKSRRSIEISKADKTEFSHLSFQNQDWRYLNLSKHQAENTMLSPTAGCDKCQSAAPCCTPGLAQAVPREEQLLFCKASYLMCSQSTPSKNGLLFISSTPDAPILCSHSQQNLGWKEEWKWRENENESIPSRNGTAFWTDTAAVS